jgi:hypothetical protein
MQIDRVVRPRAPGILVGLLQDRHPDWPTVQAREICLAALDAANERITWKCPWLPLADATPPEPARRLLVNRDQQVRLGQCRARDDDLGPHAS